MWQDEGVYVLFPTLIEHLVRDNFKRWMKTKLKYKHAPACSWHHSTMTQASLVKTYLKYPGTGRKNMHKISEQAQELIEQIEIQLKKSLPSNEELKTPLRKKDRGEWADAMLNLMFLMDNIIFLECGYTLEHTLRELSEQGGLTSERYRQVEEKSIRKICQNNSKEELEDLKLAIQEFSNSRQKRVTDFASNATYPDPNQTPYEDPNGKAQQKSA